MTPETITAMLAERIMHWDVGPNRMMTGGRKWSSRTRFQPAERTVDAIRLLEQANPREYSIGRHTDGRHWAKVTIRRGSR